MVIIDAICIIPFRFGFDVPVILRSSDETESVLPVPEKRMVQVTNPFALELGSGAASVTGKKYLPQITRYNNIAEHHSCFVAVMELSIS